MTSTKRAARVAEDAAESAADSDLARRLGRAGLVSRGTVYLVVAVLAVRVAEGSDEQADRQGALEAVARQPLGRGLLVVLAVGFAGYMVWRLIRAAAGRSEGGSDHEGVSNVIHRLADVGRALLYASLLASTVAVIRGGGGSNGGDAKQQAFTASLMHRAYGRWLVGAIGLGVVAGGIVLLVMGVRQEFAEKLDAGDLSPWQRRWLPRLGLAGYAARGVVVTLIGLFVVQAAASFDPGKSVGVDGALHRLAGRPYGPPLLVAVAIGLLCFALYSFVEARWRKVLDE